MTQSAPRHRHSYRDYLELEETSNTKHEYFDGQIYAMAGGTPEHAELSLAIGASLRQQLRGSRCRVFGSDLRIRVQATGLATYPDVTVVCGELQRDPQSVTTLTNPTLIVEVLSPSTEEYDRGDKLAHYQQIPSLGEVLLVSQTAARIESWRKQSGWIHAIARKGERLELSAVAATLSIDEIYAGILG